MKTMHPILLIGAYEWDAERLPITEFEDRLASLRREMDDRGWRALFLYGSNQEYAALAYFTNYTPKLRPGFAFVPREGAIRLIAGGGSRMLPAAEGLTWVKDVRAGGDIVKEIDAWTEDLDLGRSGIDVGATVGLSGIERMPSALHADVVSALERKFSVEDADPVLPAMMRKKRPRERALLCQGCSILSQSHGAIADAYGAGAPVVEAMLAGERAARELDAADVRVLYSLDGGHNLQPFDQLSDSRSDPLLGYVAVKYRGYWAEGFITLSDRPSTAHERAKAALGALSAAIRPGLTGSELASIAAAETRGLATHPVVDGTIGYGIGLSPEEAPRLAVDGDQHVAAGDVCSLRVGISDAEAGHALLSAVVAIEENEAEVLWSSG